VAVAGMVWKHNERWRYVNRDRGEREQRQMKTGNRQSMDGATNRSTCFGSTHALPLPWLVALPFLLPSFVSINFFFCHLI
jgi:hypothetical protein